MGKMKLPREANLAFFLFIVYLTISTFLWFFQRCLTNQPRNLSLSHIYSQIISIVIIFTAFYIITKASLYRDSDSHSCLVTPEPFLDWYERVTPTVEFSVQDQEVMKRTKNFFSNDSKDEFTPHALAYLEYYSNTKYDYEGHDHEDRVVYNNDFSGVHIGAVDHIHVVDESLSCDCLCGYEGDDEDNGDYEDEDFNKRIEDFIAAKKREWREEMIEERLLYIEAAKL